MNAKKDLNIFLQSKKKRAYLKNGWVKIPKLISTAQVNILKNLVSKFLKKNDNNYDNKNVNFLFDSNNKKILHTFHKISDSKAIKKFATQKKFFEISNELIGSKSKFRKCELFAKPSKIGIKSPPHQDNYYWCLKNGKSLTFWIALDKSNKKNGAMYYYDGSHSAGLVKHVASNIKGSSQEVNNKKYLKRFKKITPSLNIGDVLIHDSHIIHGSTKNNSKSNRMGLTIQFQSVKCKIDHKRKKIYLKSLNKQINKRINARI